jgi:CDP-paratose 2-epimerase
VIAADGDQGKLARVAEVELESSPVPRQARLPVLSPLQPDLLRLLLQVDREDQAEGGGGGGQAPDVELAARRIEAIGGREELQARRFQLIASPSLNRLLITGGAGFVGSNLAVSLATRHPDWEIVAFDNLYRRGSQLNLPRLEEAGVEFVKGDVREPDDLKALPELTAMIECSAEPSVMSGVDGDTGYLVHTNLTGAYNCLELARRDGAFLVFLSTSRVYPVAPQVELNLEEAETRFELAAAQKVRGVSPKGISEEFPLEGARTLYGATKLAAEVLIEEYREGLGVPAVIDRCGVIAGPWQMGKVDQGVFTHWMLAHHFRNPLSYIGFGGHGKQVRDLLHVEDLVDLVERQLLDPGSWDGRTVNVGGGRECSLSLRETTEICRRLTGNEVQMTPVEETRQGDVPIYLSDCSRLFDLDEWRPRRSAEQVLADIHEWIAADPERIAQALDIDAPSGGKE